MLALSTCCGKRQLLVCINVEKRLGHTGWRDAESVQWVFRRWRADRIQKNERRGGETMERDNEPGSVGGTGIARQTLLPGEMPMRTLGPGQDSLRGPCDG